MQWWTWILLWVAVLALTALLFVLLAVTLFRQLRALLRQFRSSADMLSQVSHNVAEPGSAYEPIADAVFADPVMMKSEYESGKIVRGQARVQRRVQRRRNHNRPQNLRDVGLDKA